jgi:1,4-dihydroxy-2-naphthoyl-CoA hydrolase
MDQEPFAYEFRVQLHDTDAAGVLFFGHLFRYLHDAYESFMESIGFPLPELIAPSTSAESIALPIVRAEANFLSPLHHGDTVSVRLTVAEVRTRSFAMDYILADRRARTCARGRTVHVLTAPEGPASIRLPEGLRQALLASIAKAPPMPTLAEDCATKGGTPPPRDS